MTLILGRTRQDWGDYIFDNLHVSKKKVGSAFYDLLEVIRRCRKSNRRSAESYCTQAINMARHLHRAHHGEVGIIGMETGLVQGLVHLYRAVTLLEHADPDAMKYFEECLDLFEERYSRERTMALLGKGLLERWAGDVQLSLNTFQCAKASASQVLEVEDRAPLEREMDLLIQDSVQCLLTPRPPSALPSSDISFVPVVGVIAAGQPLPVDPYASPIAYVQATEVTIDDEQFQVHDLRRTREVRLSSASTYFAMQVKGSSMVDLDIEDGDYVLLRQPRGSSRVVPQSGDIVAAIIEGIDQEATLKVFKHQGSRILLEPANQQYPALSFPPDDPRLGFVGVAVALFKHK